MAVYRHHFPRGVYEEPAGWEHAVSDFLDRAGCSGSFELVKGNSSAVLEIETSLEGVSLLLDFRKALEALNDPHEMEKMFGLSSSKQSVSPAVTNPVAEAG